MKVKDFEHWYQGFKEHTDVRTQIWDESRTKVYQTLEDPNDISITLYDVGMEALQKWWVTAPKNVMTRLKAVFVTEQAEAAKASPKA